MLKASEILLETIKKDGRPERLLRQYEGATFYPPNPANNYVRGNRHRGMEPMKDLFGTEILWPQEQLAAMPHVTEDNKVIDDDTEERADGDPGYCRSVLGSGFMGTI